MACGHTPSGGRYGGGVPAGGGDLRLLRPEHSRAVYCNKDHYGPVYGGGADTGDTGLHVLMISGRGGCEGDVDGGSGGGTYGGGEGYGRCSDRDGQLIR